MNGRSGRARGIVEAIRDGYAEEPRLPPRYRTDGWHGRFQAAIHDAVGPGQTVLDVGPGRQPTLAPERRPPGVHYVALDRSASELDQAGGGSYDETIVAAAEDYVRGHEGRFDLAISYMALEHIKPLDAVLRNVHAYLRPGGALIAQLAGGRSPFAIANRIIPKGLTRRLLGRTQGRPPESVFPVHYDRCSYSGLASLLDGGWTDWRVEPFHVGYGYVQFSRVLRALYMGFEEWAVSGDHKNLAVHYLIVARA